jgi:phosphoglycolate phosphatase
MSATAKARLCRPRCGNRTRPAAPMTDKCGECRHGLAVGLGVPERSWRTEAPVSAASADTMNAREPPQGGRSGHAREHGQRAESPVRARRRQREQTLLLFDIDGTLLHLRGTAAHRDAVYAALTAVFGLQDPAAAGVETWGKTDLQIAREILVASGSSTAAFEELAAEYCGAAAQEFALRCAPELTGDVIAGIPDLLAGIGRRDDVILGLLTGNIREIAELKITRAGLGRFFADPVAAYGCEAEDRAALPVIARSRAGTRSDPHPPERTWIIGDTPHDIRCAHADGARCIAVTSGVHTASQLQSADQVAETTEELRWVIDLALGRLCGTAEDEG